jgi:hypothetical protein
VGLAEQCGRNVLGGPRVASYRERGGARGPGRSSLSGRGDARGLGRLGAVEHMLQRRGVLHVGEVDAGAQAAKLLCEALLERAEGIVALLKQLCKRIGKRTLATRDVPVEGAR